MLGALKAIHIYPGTGGYRPPVAGKRVYDYERFTGSVRSGRSERVLSLVSGVLTVTLTATSATVNNAFSIL